MEITEFDYKRAAKVISQADIDDVERVIETSPSFRKAAKARQAILGPLRTRCGWSNEITLCTEARIKITSQKGNIGLCVQTGNMSRLYADILKLEYLFSEGRVDAAFYIVPVKDLANTWGQNIANYERLTREILIFKRIISVPLLVLGIQHE